MTNDSAMRLTLSCRLYQRGFIGSGELAEVVDGEARETRLEEVFSYLPIDCQDAVRDYVLSRGTPRRVGLVVDLEASRAAPPLDADPSGSLRAGLVAHPALTAGRMN